MRTFFKNIIVTVVLVLSLFSFETKGQIGSVYPVDLNVMLTPPYGTCLTDLSNSNRFVIQALLRDMNHGNNYEMLIQMRVKSLSSMNTVFLSYSNKFSIGMGKPAVVLGAGNTPVSISNFFERGNVLIGQNILNDNCLPEGAYLFCFQAFDAKAYYAKQRIPISKEFTITAFLENGATPILISPANNDSLSCQLPNVIFQWQQPYITSGINSYTLQVAEANSPFDGPQIIENGGNLLIEKRGLMMPICDIPVTEANFKENHTYYWRVVMCDKEGKARASYPNKGASPVYKFVYCGTPQEPEPEDAWVPQIPMAKSIKKSLDRLRIDTVLSDESSCSAYWFQDPMDVREKYDGVIIEVKKKNQDTWTPFLMESKVATDTLVALSSLAYKETYMARGQYFLYEDGEKVYAPYSDTIEFKIPHPADTLECGNAAPELTDCTNAGERTELEIGDEFNANGTTVSIDTITSQTISGSSVIISGEGHLPFPILSNFGLKVSFDNIEINCADELKKGQVISVYDEKTAAMIDLNNILGKGAAGNDLKQEDASLTEVGPDDDLSGFKSGDLIVEDGKVSLIVGNGNVVQVGTVIDLSNSDAYNDNGALNDEDIYVKFSNPDHENIAFDDDPTGMIRRAATLSDKYVSFGEEYIIPWVATNPGRIFQLTATPSKDLSKSGFTDVKFVLPASGTHVVLDAVENGDGSYSVSIPGMKVDVQNQVYAIARKGEGSPYENVGKLNLCCYSYKSKKVVIVSLLEGLSVNTDEVKKDLDRVYAKLGYTFEVELDDDAAHREGLSTTIGLETDFLSDFSDEMKELIFNYEINIGDAYDKDAAYLFLLDKPTGKYKDAAGIMPQRQQYGFIFMREVTSVTPSITHTMAHELGHGIFGLDHIFSGAYGIKKGATPNLMDYTEKTPNDALSYHEWTQINLPLPSWSALSRVEDDMWTTDGHYYLYTYIGMRMGLPYKEALTYGIAAEKPDTYVLTEDDLNNGYITLGAGDKIILKDAIKGSSKVGDLLKKGNINIARPIDAFIQDGHYFFLTENVVEWPDHKITQLDYERGYIYLGKDAQGKSQRIYFIKSLQAGDMFENITWLVGGPQQKYHCLTGGYHGVELAVTAYMIKYCLVSKNNEKDLMSYLLHRFGDAFAHLGMSSGQNKFNINTPLDSYIDVVDKYLNSKLEHVDFTTQKLDKPIERTFDGLKPKVRTTLDSFTIKWRMLQSVIRCSDDNELLDLDPNYYLINSTFESDDIRDEILKVLKDKFTDQPHLEYKMYGNALDICNGSFTLGHGKDYNFRIDDFEYSSEVDDILRRKELFKYYVKKSIELFQFVNNADTAGIFSDICNIVEVADKATSDKGMKLDALFAFHTYLLRVEEAKNKGETICSFKIPIKRLLDNIDDVATDAGAYFMYNIIQPDDFKTTETDKNNRYNKTKTKVIVDFLNDCLKCDTTLKNHIKSFKIQYNTTDFKITPVYK